MLGIGKRCGDLSRTLQGEICVHVQHHKCDQGKCLDFTNLHLGHYTGQGIVVTFPAGARDFSLLRSALNCSIIHQSSYPIGKGDSCHKDKAARA